MTLKHPFQIWMEDEELTLYDFLGIVYQGERVIHLFYFKSRTESYSKSYIEEALKGVEGIRINLVIRCLASKDQFEIIEESLGSNLKEGLLF